MVQKKLVYAIALTVVAMAAAVVLLNWHGRGPGTAAPATAANHGSNSSKVLFNNTQFASFAYLIYPGSISQQSKAAMAGFGVSVSKFANGSAGVTLTFNGTGGSNEVTLSPGYKLYFIETSFSDDSFDTDSSLGDDAFVVVDNYGYVAS
ncbi:MAG: hypothetical protein KGI00_01860 [Candidatus Micrarchaeota archaeon]|nr:hypothetical protein [Candidatus Micrarchaeota archaeon]MDE1823856.1 hypothetical protein [Candidatus Micrarchaeota archaeon]MDE1849454.1 hypothetical protein [Candidatus Micrarchaeota archaeon]